MRPALARIRQEEMTPSLFPFLAVMICTIGALVFILAISIAHASQEAKEELQDERAELELGEEYLTLAEKELQLQREDVQSRIDRTRGSLTHLEDHIQRIETEIAAIQATINAANDKGRTKSSDKEAREHEIAARKQELENLQKQLRDKVEAEKTTRPAFSIIPYAGPNGTARRPIYLECVAKGVILQPEGILISLDDLRPPHAPGNPLDSALRKIRSRFQDHDGSSTSAAPYPLLLVRPEGIASYSLARAAMASWDDQHGYELIDADMPLAFPESLPGLKPELEQVIAKARVRQQELIAALPKRMASSLDRSVDAQDLAVEYGDDTPLPNGRVLNEGDVFIPESELPGFAAPPGFGGGGGGRGGDEFGDSSNWPELSGGVSAPSSIRTAQNVSATPGGTGGPGEYANNASGSGTSNNQSYSVASNGTGDGSGNGNADGTATQQSMTASGAQGATPGSDQSMQSGNPSLSQFGSPSGASVTGASTPSTGANGQQERELRQELSKNDASSPSQPTAVARPNSKSTKSNKANKRGTTAIANEMGEDWAVQRRQLSNTPIHRAIHVRVSHDRWQIISPHSKQRVLADIALADGPREAKRKLQEAIKSEVDDWGVAVSQGYWVPIIKIFESPDSAWASQQLTTMLEGSGAKVEVLRQE